MLTEGPTGRKAPGVPWDPVQLMTERLVSQREKSNLKAAMAMPGLAAKSLSWLEVLGSPRSFTSSVTTVGVPTSLVLGFSGAHSSQPRTWGLAALVATGVSAEPEEPAPPLKPRLPPTLGSWVCPWRSVLPAATQSSRELPSPPPPGKEGWAVGLRC